MGIKRFLRLQKMKIYRIRDFPDSVAIGLAWGTSISFTPLLGLHLIICYFGTFAMRGNLIAATVGSVIGNPWTFPFFFYFSYKIGVFFFTPLEIYEFKISFLIENFGDLFLPTFVGSIPIAILVWFITYYVTKHYLEKKINEKKNKTRS
ncbi:MAG: DUF2062 domain-containing protein [Pseudomonadota bacterium]|nr:DUF2062 domain-containing protein [Pseudomonadota bacterium]